MKLNNFIDQLCPNCGLCCDSTLFADVELRKGDDVKRLEKSGLTIFQKSKTKIGFPQPCACFDGKLCTIYPDRPKRCRLFECGLLKKVQAGEITSARALKKIAKAKKLAGRVRELLRQSGQRDEQMALTPRYAEAMSASIDLAKDDSKLRGKLMRAMPDLMELLHRDFLQ
ncbi:MAG TPA: YkgJ family cysteine cluster protein [Verrucomicrobiae bacterium]|nr:YkgJ family cysteine cluster protein [Verrucomicrobiae bacterium]